MALVTSIEKSQKQRLKVHQPTRCLYSVVESEEGRRYIQLDTIGSNERQFAEKPSQTIQFDRDAAQQLLTLLREVFPGLA